MKKGNSYPYTSIENYANSNGFHMETYGEEIVGKELIVLEHEDEDKTISFVLTGATGGGMFIYECVYCDI